MSIIGRGSLGSLPSSLRNEKAGATSLAAAIGFTALSEGGYGVVFSAVAGLLLWWAVVCAVALAPRSVRDIPGPARAALWLLGAYSVWAVLSVLWAADAGGALSEAAKLLAYSGAFCAAVLLARRGSPAMWIWGLAGGLVAVAIIALSVRFFPGLEGDRETLQAALPSAQGRLGFPLGYWNALAALMAMAIVLLAPLAVFAQHRYARSACTALICVPVLVIFLASSRGGAVAAAAGAVTLLAISPGRAPLAATFVVATPGSLLVTAFAADRDALLQGLGTDVASEDGLALFLVTAVAVAATFAARLLLDEQLLRLRLPRWARRALPVAAAVLVLGALTAADPVTRWQEFKDPPDFGKSQSSFVASHLQSGNGNGRYQFWGTAIDGLGEDPLKGLGAGGFETYWNQNGPIEYRLRDAHSLVFEASSELGLPGLLAIAGFFGLAIWTGLRRALSDLRDEPPLPVAAILVGVLATGLAAVLVDWTWEIPVVALPMLIVVAQLTGRPVEPPGPGTSEGRSGAGAVRVAILAAGAVSILVLGNVFLTQLQLRESRDAAGRGDFEEAADAADRAAALSPWAAEPRTQSALISERLGDLDAARSEIDAAIDRSPDDWKLRVIAARLALEAADARAAADLLAEARRLNPRSAILLERPLPPGILPESDQPTEEP